MGSRTDAIRVRSLAMVAMRDSTTVFMVALVVSDFAGSVLMAAALAAGLAGLATAFIGGLETFLAIFFGACLATVCPLSGTTHGAHAARESLV